MAMKICMHRFSTATAQSNFATHEQQKLLQQTYPMVDARKQGFVEWGPRTKNKTRDSSEHSDFQTDMGDVLPVYNGEADVYSLSNGVDFLSNNSNILKITVPDMLQRPNNLQYATGHQLQTESGAVPTKLASWNMNPVSVFGEASINDDNQPISSSLAAASLLVGPNPTEGINSRNSSDDAMQSFLLRNGYSGYSDPVGMGNFISRSTHSLGQPVDQGDQAHQFHASGFTQRSSNMQSVISNLAPTIQERFFNNQSLSGNSGEFCQNQSWGNAGTELLLLPGSGEAVGRTFSRDTDFHTRPSLPAYGVNQASLPFAQWERSDLLSGKDERAFQRDNVPIGNMRHGQGLSLSLSSQEYCQPSFHSYDMRLSASGSFGILRNSKYLRPTQQLLDEFCNVGRGLKKGLNTQNSIKSQAITEAGNAAERDNKKMDSSIMEAVALTKDLGVPCQLKQQSSDAPPDSTIKSMHPDERNQLQMKKARLISMVEECAEASSDDDGANVRSSSKSTAGPYISTIVITPGFHLQRLSI